MLCGYLLIDCPPAGKRASLVFSARQSGEVFVGNEHAGRMFAGVAELRKQEERQGVTKASGVSCRLDQLRLDAGSSAALVCQQYKVCHSQDINVHICISLFPADCWTDT